MRASVLLAGLLVPLLTDAAPARLLVEAESFADCGGWTPDAQFMDQMGSPYLLAHGLGVPVKDAATTVRFPSPGTYRVWARTKDWVAPWHAPGTPGRFRVLVDGQPLAAEFGTEGAAWHWQDGGTITVAQAQATLALRDLTGFEGRCDALLFASDTAWRPPDSGPELAALRRTLLGLPETPEPGGDFDLVVAGGGIAGTCAAIAAARLGLSVALVQDRPVLGGNNSSEVRVWLQGARNKEPWPRVGDVVGELEQAKQAHYGPSNTAELYEDEKKVGVARAEPKLKLFLQHRVNGAETHGTAITAVLAQDALTGRRLRLAGKLFADCTGDGDLGALAGADFELTPKGHMGPCNLWNVKETDRPQTFPRCPWALDLRDKPFPGRSKDKPDPNKLGGWYWESGFDLDPIARAEEIRDWNFRAMYGAWDALKNADGVFTNYALNWSAYVRGRRESRRLLGDVVLTKQDLETSRTFPDGCVPTGWKMDLHLPDPHYEKGFEGNAFISTAHFGSYPMPFWVPYRCLYSRNVSNLFMAGRDISVTHDALGAVRVMRTGGCMGEVVGMAASVAVKRSATPRAVYERYLGDLQDLMRRGIGKVSGATVPYANQGEPARKPAPAGAGSGSAPAGTRSPGQSAIPPAWLSKAGVNLARAAHIAVFGGKDSSGTSPDLMIDGKADLSDNSQRWLSAPGVPQQIELAWDAPQAFSALRLLSGFREDSGALVGAIQAWTLQIHDGAGWRDVPGAGATENVLADWSATFAPQTASRVRLNITATRGDVARLWEIELYRVVF
jgi:hypothetical protein